MKNTNSDRKNLIREYKETPRRMGVFQIRNLVNEKVLVGASINLDGILNRHGFQLKMGGHSNKQLQADWNELGGENFAFEVLEEVVPRENLDYKVELIFLEDLWLEKLAPFDDKGYNEKKKSREERLQMIAANRLK